MARIEIVILKNTIKLSVFWKTINFYGQKNINKDRYQPMVEIFEYLH